MSYTGMQVARGVIEPMEFTQFIPPNGRRISTSIEVPSEVEAKAHELRTAGWCFEIERLHTGHINMDCCDNEGELAGEMCMNGPEVPPTVVKLVTKAYERWIEQGKPLANAPPSGMHPADRLWDGGF